MRLGEELKLRGWSEKEIQATLDFFEAEENQQDCRDNLRTAKADSEEETNKYWEIESTGCCGFCDKVLDVDGVKILVGYNYGH